MKTWNCGYFLGFKFWQFLYQLHKLVWKRSPASHTCLETKASELVREFLTCMAYGVLVL
jgi:hypothetical protein